MPQRLRRKCNKWGCKALTTKTHCSKHEKPRSSWAKPPPRRNRLPNGKKIYDGKWKKLRDAFLNNPKNALCVECKRRGVIESATEVDHIIPIAKRPDLRLDERNLQPLCKPCHSRKTAYEVNKKIKESKTKPLIDIYPEGIYTDYEGP